jgi:type IV pilus assembly protein PilP
MNALRSLLLAGVALLLAGCGASGEDELRQWMAAQRQQTQPKVQPIAEPKPFKPEPYAGQGAADPFSKAKLTQALKNLSAQPVYNALITPELKRRKEALEAFPLDTMTMVGSLLKEGRPVALIKADNLLHQVRVGNYLGPNYGRITRITETEVTVREIVQDAVGEWVTRPATLQLQERTK